jgi:hypothetical protein
MTELPENDNSGGIDNTSSSKVEQNREGSEHAATDPTAAGSNKATEFPSELPAGATVESGENSSNVVVSDSGKRDRSGANIMLAAPIASSAGMGIMGFNTAKRGRREWLAFRGSRQTRVGESYQVASLPPVEGTKTFENETGNGKGK